MKLLTRLLAAVLISFCSAHGFSADAKPEALHFDVTDAGLAVLARAGDGFALAGDGAQLNADGTISQTQRVFQVGKNGALLIAGTTSFQDPVNKPVRRQVDVSAISARWLDAHRDADLNTAEQEITAQVLNGLKAFLPARRKSASTAATKLRVVLIFAGYVNGQPLVKGTKFRVAGVRSGPVQTQAISGLPRTGEVWAFGVSAVEPELAKAVKGRNDSAADYAKSFDTVLKTGEKTQSKRVVMGGPDKLAIVSEGEGFSWK